MSRSRKRRASPAPRLEEVRAEAPLFALAVLFFLSGAAALMVEVVWQRWFRLLLGATAPATAATLVAFFAGQALGAILGARLASRWRKPLVFYALAELGAAAAALGVPLLLAGGEWWLSRGYDALLETPSTLVAMRFVLALGVSLPAAIGFGATFPAIAAAAMPDARQLGSKGSGLYGANLLGAVCGTVLAAFVLPEWVGLRTTYGLAILLSVAAGCGALLLARRQAPRVATRPEPERSESERSARPRAAPVPGRNALGALALLSGFGSFAFQVLLVHAFGLVLDQSVYAFGLVLVSVLATLAVGAICVAVLEGHGSAHPSTVLSLGLSATALAMAAFPALLVDGTSGLAYVGSEPAWPGSLTVALGLIARTAGPALLGAGLVFPLVLALAARGPDASGSAARSVGTFAALNTLGAIAGALAAPFVLLPVLGPWLPCALIAVAYAIAAVSIRIPQPSWRLRRDLALGLGWMLILSRANPLSLPVVHLAPETIIHLDHTPAGTVAVALRDGERLIQIDNHYALGGTAERVHQERQAHLPLLLAPQARRLLYVGSATGISAGAALAHPLEEIVLVELVPGVARVARTIFRDANRAVHEDPRVTTVLDDARNFIRFTRSHFDVIVSDLFVPWRAGTGSLYTREHFSAARDRLSPDGLFCQWLPLYQLSAQEFRIIAATFLDVFPNASVFRGDFYGRFPIVALVGWRGAPAAPEATARAARRLAASAEQDRWVTDPAGIWSLYLGTLAPMTSALASLPRQTDDVPVLEYLSARSHGGASEGRRDPLVGAAWLALAEEIRARGRSSDALLASLSREWRAAVEGGAALQAAGAYYAAGLRDDSGRALAAASEQIPRRLLANAPADPTAAEVWFP